ncbi:hypothetical protein N7509_005651 [Penicillium cosmopolitanum]|uniref:Uncharacterized protein n=1 Tax=Penicillium cosmopolitanum TaxID=1131564 RepID=A0A9W9W2K5_9EURO|nr:uncharacterized protein N7509_005651 [Penicillium cosmopolitanum]KAJ5397538.1 hypothetical protein N7509_005651 [Penicillium cosmopolitanum]
MSDDDEYYEWDEDYLLEDLVPDLVDELAQTSYYEAALYEDPSFEVEDYFSDWEYYSDDYHDDDPTVKTTAPPAQKKARRAQAQAKATTTNRVAGSKFPAIPDISSFQGVIWKTPSLDPYQDVAVFYEPIGNKVALLKDWREVFKSAQPALDKSRLRKRKARDQETDAEGEDAEADLEMSFADDEFPCDGDDEKLGNDDQVDSSMSDIVSMDNMSETGDAGEASNTTPEFTQSPKEVPAVAPTSTPAKRGRKRKAEVPAEEANKDNPGTESPRTTRSKRVASKKADGEGSLSGASTAPTRRSTRQKK